MLCVADAESARLGFGRRKTAEKRFHIRLYSTLSRRLLCGETHKRVVVALEETDATAASEARNLRCKLCGIFLFTNLPQKEVCLASDWSAPHSLS